MLKLLKELWQDEDGASAVEYGLILGLIAAVIIVVLTTLGGKLNGLFSNVANALP